MSYSLVYTVTLTCQILGSATALAIAQGFDIESMGLFPPASAVESINWSCLSVCVFLWVYSGHIIHHYNGILATCAPGRRNMHHSGAIWTTVHKGDYVFWKIQGTLMIWLIYRFTSIWRVTLLQLFLGSQVFFIRVKDWWCQRCPHTGAGRT